jgi:hypothetical protein
MSDDTLAGDTVAAPPIAWSEENVVVNGNEDEESK